MGRWSAIVLPYNAAVVVPMTSSGARLLPRPDHNISRRNIDANALKVLYRLERAGFESYLVGGSVRDLLLGRTPKDYDVSTSARPEEIRRLFRNSRIIGRRFRLAHVFFHQGIIEVSTFRRAPDRKAQRGGPEDLLVTDDNLFGTPSEDAFRRDFTINALYYDISDFSVVDYVGGLRDLEARLIRVIGDPEVRFKEDPVRMLRACELAARMSFGIDDDAQRSIQRNRHELEKAAAPRLREELLEILRCGRAGLALQWMLDLGLLEILLPELGAMLHASESGLAAYDRVVFEIDQASAKKMDDVVLLAAILAPHVLVEHQLQITQGERRSKGQRELLVEECLAPFMRRFAMPGLLGRRTTHVLELLLRLEDPSRGRWERRHLSRSPGFGATLEVYRLLVRATGHGRDQLEAWRAELRDKSEIPAAQRPRKRRRRPHLRR